MKENCRGCGNNDITDDYGFCEDCTRDGTHTKICVDDVDIEFYCSEHF